MTSFDDCIYTGEVNETSAVDSFFQKGPTGSDNDLTLRIKNFGKKPEGDEGEGASGWSSDFVVPLKFGTLICIVGKWL